MPSSITLKTAPKVPALGNYISAIKNHDTSRRLTPQDQLGVQTLGRNVGLALDQVSQAISQPQTVVLTQSEIQSFIPATVKIVEVQLTTATTNIVVPSVSAEGVFLVVFVIQDATGGRLITWDTNFRYTTTNIDTTASKTSVFQFVSRIDPAVGAFQWFMINTPLTGAS
jgi:hypothetical protein